MRSEAEKQKSAEALWTGPGLRLVPGRGVDFGHGRALERRLSAGRRVLKVASIADKVKELWLCSWVNAAAVPWHASNNAMPSADSLQGFHC